MTGRTVQLEVEGEEKMDGCLVGGRTDKKEDFISSQPDNSITHM